MRRQLGRGRDDHSGNEVGGGGTTRHTNIDRNIYSHKGTVASLYSGGGTMRHTNIDRNIYSHKAPVASLYSGGGGLRRDIQI